MKGIDPIAFEKTAVNGKKIAVVITRWNKMIVDSLLEAATNYLIDHGIGEEDITVVKCPGAYEVPLTCKAVAQTKQYDAIITLGAVIRGGTPHFEFVAGECARGITDVSLQYGLPIAFGVLTVDNEQQALDRAGLSADSENKGEEAAAAALEMLVLIDQLSV